MTFTHIISNPNLFMFHVVFFIMIVSSVTTIHSFTSAPKTGPTTAIAKSSCPSAFTSRSIPSFMNSEKKRGINCLLLLHSSKEDDTTQENYYTNNDEDADSDLDAIILTKSQEYFQSNLLYTLQVTNHKPSLGCTAEESLNSEQGGNKFVFVSKLVPGGAAATAGLEIGDLIVGLSGTFDTVEDVFGQGLDRV